MGPELSPPGSSFPWHQWPSSQSQLILENLLCGGGKVLSPLTPKTGPTEVIHREKQAGMAGNSGGCRTHQHLLHFLPSPSPVQARLVSDGKGMFRQIRSLCEHQVLHSSQDLINPPCPCHLQLVGNQDNSLSLECLLNALLKDMLPHMGIHS